MYFTHIQCTVNCNGVRKLTPFKYLFYDYFAVIHIDSYAVSKWTEN